MKVNIKGTCKGCKNLFIRVDESIKSENGFNILCNCLIKNDNIVKELTWDIDKNNKASGVDIVSSVDYCSMR